MISILHISSAKNWRGGENQIVNLIEGINDLPSETYQNLLCRKDSALHLYCLENKINFTLISNHFFSSIKTAKIILKKRILKLYIFMTLKLKLMRFLVRCYILIKYQSLLVEKLLF